MGMVLVEALPEQQPSGTSAQVSRQLQSYGLADGPMIEMPVADGLSRYFAAYRLPGVTTDCKLIVDGVAPLAFLHGTDCNMVRAIAKDMRTGTQSPFEFCDRRAAGGAFEKIDISAVTLKSSWPDIQPVVPPAGQMCPDCAGVVDAEKKELVHQPTCPLMVAQQSVIDEDREYFKTHPGETTRQRPPVMAEILNVMLQTHNGGLPGPPPGHHWEPGGFVTVVLVSEGVRVRRYGDALAVAVRNED
ncbi:hypothetical protein ABQF33_17330 [Mycolicibacterium sp. XJ2]